MRDKILKIIYLLWELLGWTTAYFDVFLLDIVMERVDGIEACRQLRAAGFEAPVVAVTANGDAHHRRLMAEAGFSLLVTKPFDKSDLETALSVAIGAEAS